MRRLLLLLLVGLAQAADEALDVCIIGAGPAGVGAALALAKKSHATGNTFALLERQAVVGGQTTPQYRDPATGFRVHMGAVCAFPALTPGCAL